MPRTSYQTLPPLKLDRIVVDADVAVERLRNHIETNGNVGSRLAVG